MLENEIDEYKMVIGVALTPTKSPRIFFLSFFFAVIKNMKEQPQNDK